MPVRSKKVVATKVPIVPAIAIAVSMVFASAAYLYANRKDTVVVGITVHAPNGGVFEDPLRCAPRLNYQPLLDAILITAADGTPITIPASDWRTADTNRCTREIVLSLSPNQTYNVAIGATGLGQLDEATFLTKQAEFLHTIVVEQDLRGALQLKQTADSCVNRTSGWRCTWSPVWQVSLDLNEKTGACSGNGGYSDIRAGAQVKIYSSKDVLLSTSEVTSTNYDLVSTKSRIIYCELRWSVENVPNDDFGYYIEISSRGKVFFSTAKLIENGWVMNTVLEDK